MQILKLFLSLFGFLLFLFLNRKNLLHALYILFQTVQSLTRVLAEKGIRISFEPHEKYIIATLFEHTRHAERFFSLFSTKTIFSVWKHIFSGQWTHPHKKPGRKPVTKAEREMVLKLKKENPLWGLRRIRDELHKISIELSHETINKILRHFRKTGDIKPVLSWKRFLSSHWKSLFACDFFTADIFGFKRFYIFFIMELKSRKIVLRGITSNPSIQFLRNQFSVFEYEYPSSTLIHDNFGELRWFPYDQYNFKHVGTVPYSPDMNAYAERFVRSVRQECLDYFLIFTRGQLDRIIQSYIDYYNNYRPHQGLKGIPNGPPEGNPGTGEIKQKPLLFGLHNHYYREAA
jgi:hypothetical protein